MPHLTERKKWARTSCNPDLNGESVLSKVTGSVNKVGTQPVMAVDDIGDDKKKIKTLKSKSLKQEKALKIV